jgi:diadenosine tetraphosphate (Ap4A) HIT family hydrolase
MNPEASACMFCRRFGAESRRDHPGWVADLEVSSATLENNQLCRGYTILVYTKGHATELFELSKEDRIAYMEDLTRLAKALHDAYRPDKINYALLGNLVPHLHWHLVPRKDTDPLDVKRPVWGQEHGKVTLSDDEYREIAAEIRKHLE